MNELYSLANVWFHIKNEHSGSLCLRFGVFKAKKIQVAVLWVVTPRSDVISRLHLQHPDGPTTSLHDDTTPEQFTARVSQNVSVAFISGYRKILG